MSNQEKELIEEAIADFTKLYNEAKDYDYVRKPISYALYNAWRKWDAKEKPKKSK